MWNNQSTNTVNQPIILRLHCKLKRSAYKLLYYSLTLRTYNFLLFNPKLFDKNKKNCVEILSNAHLFTSNTNFIALWLIATCSRQVMQIADSSALREQNWIKARNDFNKQILDLQMQIDEIQRENRWEFVFMSQCFAWYVFFNSEY